jgi:hypothetical protein
MRARAAVAPRDLITASLQSNLRAARQARLRGDDRAAYAPALILGALARHSTRRSVVIAAKAELRRLRPVFGEALPEIAR